LFARDVAELHELRAEQAPCPRLRAPFEDALEVLALDQALAHEVAAEPELLLLDAPEREVDAPLLHAHRDGAPRARAVLLDLEDARLALVREELQHLAERYVLELAFERHRAFAPG